MAKPTFEPDNAVEKSGEALNTAKDLLDKYKKALVDAVEEHDRLSGESQQAAIDCSRGDTTEENVQGARKAARLALEAKQDAEEAVKHQSKAVEQLESEWREHLARMKDERRNKAQAFYRKELSKIVSGIDDFEKVFLDVEEAENVVRTLGGRNLELAYVEEAMRILCSLREQLK